MKELKSFYYAEHFVTFANYGMSGTSGVQTVGHTKGFSHPSLPGLESLSRRFEYLISDKCKSPENTSIVRIRNKIVIQRMVTREPLGGRGGNFLTHNIILDSEDYENALEEIFGEILNNSFPFKLEWKDGARIEREKPAPISLSNPNLPNFADVKNLDGSGQFFEEVLFSLSQRILTEKQSPPIIIILKPEFFSSNKTNLVPVSLSLCILLVLSLPKNIGRQITFRTYSVSPGAGCVSGDEYVDLQIVQEGSKNLGEISLNKEFKVFQPDKEITFKSKSYVYFFLAGLCISKNKFKTAVKLGSLFNSNDIRRYKFDFSISDKQELGKNFIMVLSEESGHKKIQQFASTSVRSFVANYLKKIYFEKIEELELSEELEKPFEQDNVLAICFELLDIVLKNKLLENEVLIGDEDQDRILKRIESGFPKDKPTSFAKFREFITYSDRYQFNKGPSWVRLKTSLIEKLNFADSLNLDKDAHKIWRENSGAKTRDCLRKFFSSTKSIKVVNTFVYLINDFNQVFPKGLVELNEPQSVWIDFKKFMDHSQFDLNDLCYVINKQKYIYGKQKTLKNCNSFEYFLINWVFGIPSKRFEKVIGRFREVGRYSLINMLIEDITVLDLFENKKLFHDIAGFIVRAELYSEFDHLLSKLCSDPCMTRDKRELYIDLLKLFPNNFRINKLSKLVSCKLVSSSLMLTKTG